VSLDKWEFTIDDGTNVLRRWDWKSFRDLPAENFTVDLHCVTGWSKLGTSWEGVSLDTLLADVKTNAQYALANSYGGYTTNLLEQSLPFATKQRRRGRSLWKFPIGRVTLQANTSMCA